jgi:hypothetical protein
MGCRQLDAKLFPAFPQKVQKAHRIGAAGNPGHYFIAFLNHMVFCDGFEKFLLNVHKPIPLSK